MSKKREAEDTLSNEKSQAKKRRPEILTFKNRDGQIQSTHSWPAAGDGVALRTAARADVGESIFLASRTILSRDSAVFSSMFSLPQPDTAASAGTQSLAPTYEGHPLVDVDDHPADLQDFLEALHDYWTYSSNPRSKSVVQITGLLRLSAKYQAGSLHRRILEKLSKRYPTSFQQFQDTVAAPSSAHSPRASDHSFTLSALVGIDYPIMLPVAAYQLAMSYHFSELAMAPICSFGIVGDISGPWFASEESKAWTLKIHNAMGRSFLKTLKDVLGGKYSLNCVRKTECGRTYRDWFEPEGHSPQKSTLQLAEDPLPALNRAAYNYRTAGLCVPCCTRADVRLDSKLEELWGDLPLIMGLDKWDVLKERSLVNQTSDQLGDELPIASGST